MTSSLILILLPNTVTYNIKGGKLKLTPHNKTAPCEQRYFPIAINPGNKPCQIQVLPTTYARKFELAPMWH
jgi:hypothetical protein